MVTGRRAAGRAVDAESAPLLALLRRYARHQPDQWEAWRTGTPYCPVHVQLFRGLPSGSAPEKFRPF
ncbi:hypothetical protein ACF06W_20180 [Streptomyces albus]|uniref:hypothetical protein n=1 Tax=Streptomyces albus TaxID=1888 RepID=UPI003700065B